MIGCSDAVGRIAFLMLSLYHRQAARAEIDPLACPFPLRRQHLADALGLTGAHINRTLNRLREEGIALLENQLLSIRDLAAADRTGHQRDRAEPAARARPQSPAARRLQDRPGCGISGRNLFAAMGGGRRCPTAA